MSSTFMGWKSEFRFPWHQLGLKSCPSAPHIPVSNVWALWQSVSGAPKRMRQNHPRPLPKHTQGGSQGGPQKPLQDGFTWLSWPPSLWGGTQQNDQSLAT